VRSTARLSAFVVNYQSGALASACVASFFHEWKRAGRSLDDLEIIVVENGSPTDQEEHMLAIEAQGARVLRSKENLGYSGGMNLAFDESSGEADDQVAILNPDLFFLPGSIGTLMDYLLEHPECGAVDPSTSIDPLGVMQLPRNLLPTLLDHTRVTLAHMSPRFALNYSRHRMKVTLPYWLVTGPVKADMLSGCCLFLTRANIAKAGRDIGGMPMDPRYPLYYEDTDLFRRMASVGLTTIHHGGARIIHHWSRSAGAGGEYQEEPMRRYHLSQAAYYERFYGKRGVKYVAWLNERLRKWPDEKTLRPMHPTEDLGHHESPLTIKFPRHARFVLEITMSPVFLVTAGMFGEGDSFTFPLGAWEWLFQGVYRLRALDLDNNELLGSWTFGKSCEGRKEPFSIQEMEQLGDSVAGAVQSSEAMA
jgi:N-acetylglucosaminyl-diphospho-decaprenol L-rhamnosyltransferase